MDILKELNEAQREAVTTTEGYVRVIAGAGSGKTKALSTRFAYLVNELGIMPGHILCVTFTNKAANVVSPQKDMSNALLTSGFIQKAYEMGKDNFGMFKHMMLHTAGVRRGGCAALELCYVGCGRLDGFWDLYLRPWDVAAGFLIIREAGGIVTTLSGDPDPFKEPYEFLASNPDLHPMLLRELRIGKGDTL